MVDALRAELFKTFHRRMTWILFAVLVGLVLLFYFILWRGIENGPPDNPRRYYRWIALQQGMSFINVVPYGLQLERFFATLVSVIFAATMMGNEYDWRTASVAMSRGVKRRDFLLAKLLVTIGFVITVVTAGFLAALLCSAWFSHVFDLPYGEWSWGRIGTMVVAVLRTAFAVLPFSLMALLFATIWRSGGQAVGFSLGFFFLESIFTGLLDEAKGFISHVPEWLLNLNVAAVMKANGSVPGTDSPGIGPGFSTSAGPWTGAAFLAFWMVVFIAIAFWRFQRRDLQE